MDDPTMSPIYFRRGHQLWKLSAYSAVNFRGSD